MITNFDEVQKFGKENFDVALKSFGAVSKQMQAIASEVADYSKKSFEDSTAVVEKLMGAKTVEKAIEVQTDFAKSAYEGFVSEATKLSTLYADLAKETYKPFETVVSRQSNAA
jgi:phasin family protein